MKEDLKRLEWNDRIMIRWIYGVTLNDRLKSEALIKGLGLDSIRDAVQIGRLRWFGHVERMDPAKWVRKCREINVPGTRGRGRPKKF